MIRGWYSIFVPCASLTDKYSPERECVDALTLRDMRKELFSPPVSTTVSVYDPHSRRAVALDARRLNARLATLANTGAK
jgi:hypothetical protein